MVERMDDFNFSIDLPVKSEWGNVDLLRTSLQNCFMVVFRNLDGCDAVAMVIGELLENAIKYGHWTGPAGEFRLRVNGVKNVVRICVENPVKPDDPGVSELMRSIEWIRSFPSPADAYRARLLEVAQAPGSAKLGLVRVCYEAHCSVDAKVDGGVLAVTAEMTF